MDTSETITYCTGAEFELVADLGGGIHRYRCKKCGTELTQALTSTAALPLSHAVLPKGTPLTPGRTLAFDLPIRIVRE